MPPLEEAATHRGLQEDPVLKRDHRLRGELQLGSTPPVSLRFSCGW